MTEVKRIEIGVDYDIDITEWNYEDERLTNDLEVSVHRATDVRYNLNKLSNGYCISIRSKDSKGKPVEFRIYSKELPLPLFKGNVLKVTGE